MPKLPDTGQTSSYATGDDASYSGAQPSYTDNGNGTVTDNNTKLIWQQQDDGTPRTWEAAGTYCSNLSLGGQTGWRLPTAKELASLVDYGRSPWDPINRTYFFNTNGSVWSSTTYANDTSAAWTVYFARLGYTSYASKSNSYGTQCVRGGSESVIWSFGNLISTTETVTMPGTGLMWQRSPDSTARLWSDALSYCQDLNLGGYTDWRMPNIRELQSIVDYSVYAPSLLNNIFVNTKSSSYWSSTGSTFSAFFVWSVDFTNGITRDLDNSNYSYTRCVRSDL